MMRGLRLCGLLTLLAVLTTSVIPQGWMPATGSDGKVLLVLCTGDGVVEQWVDLDPTDPIHDDTDERAMCPFAGLTADADIPKVGTFVPFASPILPRWDHLEFTHHTAGFHTRYDARAPPLTS